MITLHEPELTIESDIAKLTCTFEFNDQTNCLWFSVPSQYKQYLTCERGDAFLVGILLLAMKNDKDIQVNFPVSERLYYTLTTYYIKALHLANPALNQIKIHPAQLDHSSLENGGAVGTGFSGGIDSFYTTYTHLADRFPKNYKLTHFTFHNTGSHGDFGGEGSRDLFYERMNIVKQFTDEIGISVIPIDSNISEILQMNYAQTHTIRNVAAILTLQKLFSNYYYSSAYPLNFFELNSSASAAYDTFTLPMLSTENLTFFSAGSNCTRFEKTKEVANFEPSFHHLNVCASGSAKNCSKCPKCARTLLSLDIMGKCKLYDDVFDLETYEKDKRKHIAQVLAERGDDIYSQEIFEAMKQYDFDIPFWSRISTPFYKLKSQLRKIIQ